MAAVLACVFLAVMLSGCSTTVTPQQVHASQASFDGNVQNSGFICFNQDGSGTITPHARDRYNALIGVFCKKFSPELRVDDGVTLAGTNYIIDAQHLNYFKQMNRWRRDTIKPREL